MFKNRKAQIIVGVIFVVLMLFGGYYLIAGKSNSKPKADDSQSQNVVGKLSAEELGLELTAKPDKKAVKFSISKLDDIKSIEYQLQYEADSTAQERGEGGEDRVQRGITGEAKIDTSKSSYESPWLDLGSCSKNVCRYDSGVKSVDLTLKIVKKNGKIYEAEKKFDL